VIRTDHPRGVPSQMRVASLAVAVVLALGACTSSGPLGSVAPPPPSTEPSLEIPSVDVTPGRSTPSPASTARPPASPTAAPAETPGGSPTPTITASTPSPTPAGTTIVRAYFFLGSFTGNNGLAPVLREVPETKAVATAAMRQLLAGPNDKELAARPAMYTGIPEGTRLLGLAVKDGIATVDLSGEFEASEGMVARGRLAQVVYTLTQFPTVDAVRFELDGQPVSVFSDEGIVLDHPVDRADYYDLLPAIFVDRPAWGAAIGNPGPVSGLANVFEATFRVQLLDARGTTLVDRQVTATCGTGCWGTFRLQLTYDVGRSQWGTLRVFNLTARDGTPEHVTEYPVWLTPAG
jgi:germination protein M